MESQMVGQAVVLDQHGGRMEVCYRGPQGLV